MLGRRGRAWEQRGEIPAASAGMTDLILRRNDGEGERAGLWRRGRAWEQRSEIPAASAGMTGLILRRSGGCGVGAARRGG